jgi:hypothetical protein
MLQTWIFFDTYRHDFYYIEVNQSIFIKAKEKIWFFFPSSLVITNSSFKINK